MADLYFKPCVNGDMCHVVKRRSQNVNFAARSAPDERYVSHQVGTRPI